MNNYLLYFIFAYTIWFLAYHREYRLYVKSNLIIPIAVWISYEDAPAVIQFKRKKTQVIYYGWNNLSSSFSQRLSEWAEVWLLARISVFGYWNCVNMNLRFIGILLLSFIWGSPILFFRYVLEMKSLSASMYFATVGAIFTTLFWQERNSFYQKWKYLADLYNEILKAKPSIVNPEGSNFDYFSYRNGLTVALAIDIVQMEMWSHVSYKDIVEAELRAALDEKRTVKFRTRKDFLNEANKLTKEQAVKILNEYQINTISREKFMHRRALITKLYIQPHLKVSKSASNVST